MLLFTAAEIEGATTAAGVSPAVAGLLGGMGGGVVQAYATMGEFLARLSPLTDRLLHVHEDGRDHALEAQCRRREAPVDVRRPARDSC